MNAIGQNPDGWLRLHSIERSDVAPRSRFCNGQPRAGRLTRFPRVRILRSRFKTLNA